MVLSATLAKVSVFNSFRTNPKFFISFRNFYPHETVSFQFNPVIVFNPNQFEAHSKSIRTCNPFESKQSELIRMIPKNLVSFGLIELTGFIRITSSNWFWMGLVLIRIEKFLRLDRNKTVWFGYKFRNESGQSDSIRSFNPHESNQSNQSEWIRSIRINPNDSKKFGFIRINRIDADWPDSFGLQYRPKVWIHLFFHLFLKCLNVYNVELVIFIP